MIPLGSNAPLYTLGQRNLQRRQLARIARGPLSLWNDPVIAAKSTGFASNHRRVGLDQTGLAVLDAPAVTAMVTRSSA